MLGALGVTRAVLVQPSVYGTDNRAMLDAMAGEQHRMRGVAVVEETIADAELTRMHDAGVRGIRFNIVDVKPEEKGKLPLDVVRKMENTYNQPCNSYKQAEKDRFKYARHFETLANRRSFTSS
jgi:predicted TIM-barrel fold metal-dependent hydrolase